MLSVFSGLYMGIVTLFLLLLLLVNYPLITVPVFFSKTTYAKERETFDLVLGQLIFFHNQNIFYISVSWIYISIVVASNRYIFVAFSSISLVKSIFMPFYLLPTT